MLRGHVFVVSEDTLPIHLKYGFVGVSSGEKENNVNLLSDILRVKKDDYVFFYIEGRPTKKGRFFGVFKVKDNLVYHFLGANASAPELPKKLIYRKEIIPYKVYPKGVLEWVALDKLPTYSKELLWSLIYRKMKAKRGNTMLFPWEVEKLISLLVDENDNTCVTGTGFDFDKTSYEITPGHNLLFDKSERIIQLSINDTKKNESHLQAYFMQKITLGKNLFFKDIFGENLVWLGNEVFAGTGMQKIDVLTIEKKDETELVYRIIELKHPKSSTNLSFAPGQLEYYVNWAREDIGGHLIGGKKINLKPILISLTKVMNSTPTSIISEIKALASISNNPEIWEMDFDGNVNKVL